MTDYPALTKDEAIEVLTLSAWTDYGDYAGLVYECERLVVASDVSDDVRSAAATLLGFARSHMRLMVHRVRTFGADIPLEGVIEDIRNGSNVQWGWSLYGVGISYTDSEGMIWLIDTIRSDLAPAVAGVS